MLQPSDLDARIRCVRDLTRKAGGIALEFFDKREELSVEKKGLQDFVSIADREVETVIRDGILDAFPDDAIIGEEHGGGLADPCWVIDPIDGTANFLRGFPYWCVAVAFVVDGETEIALTYDPVHDEMFEARSGGGAMRNGRSIQVSGRTGDACVGLAFTFKQEPEPFLAASAALVRRGIDQRRVGSSALLLAHVADGRFDAMGANYVNSWDVLPGLTLVREAGGLATRYLDGASLLEPRGVIAGTRAMVPVLEACMDQKL